MFSDECIFRVNGCVNKQNVRICPKERPSQISEAPRNSPGVMVWCAISKEKIIGPLFFDKGSFTGAIYRYMLIRYAFPRFSELREDYIFMQHGASRHYAVPVRNYLNQKRPNKLDWQGGTC